MTDQDFEHDLEQELREHYRSLRPDTAGRSNDRVADALDRTSTGGQGFAWGPGRIRAAGLVMAAVAAAVVFAVVLLPLLYGPPAGPHTIGTPTVSAGATATTSTTSPAATSTPAIATEPPGTNGTLLPEAQASAFGRMRSGGVWAIQGSTVWTSEDLKSWQGHSPTPLPAPDTIPATVFVLDQDHAWTVTLGPGSINPEGGQGPDYDHLKAVVNRWDPKSSIWRQAAVPGDYADDALTLSFVDAQRGFLICSGGGSAAEITTILRTLDGGATWAVVATLPGTGDHANLGAEFTASDASTLWAGAQGEAHGHGHWLFALSRDGGKTWSDVALPGLEGVVGGFDAGLNEPPVFLDPMAGFVTVWSVNGNIAFGTTDGGRTWTRENVPQDSGNTQTSAFVDATHWIAWGWTTGLNTTADAGKTWTKITPSGLLPGGFAQFVFVDPLDGVGSFQLDPNPGTLVLYETIDGGHVWSLLPLSAAGTGGGPLTGQQMDVASAKQTVASWENALAKGSWQYAWELLSPYEQALFGSEQSFATSAQAKQAALGFAGKIGEPTRDPGSFGPAYVGQAVWADVTASADLGRAYLVVVTHPQASDASLGSERLLVAPMQDGSWRIWIIH